jgi:hypothetical protein
MYAGIYHFFSVYLTSFMVVIMERPMVTLFIACFSIFSGTPQTQ